MLIDFSLFKFLDVGTENKKKSTDANPVFLMPKSERPDGFEDSLDVPPALSDAMNMIGPPSTASSNHQDTPTRKRKLSASWWCDIITSSDDVITSDDDILWRLEISLAQFISCLEPVSDLIRINPFISVCSILHVLQILIKLIQKNFA